MVPKSRTLKSARPSLKPLMIPSNTFFREYYMVLSKNTKISSTFMCSLKDFVYIHKNLDFYIFLIENFYIIIKY